MTELLKSQSWPEGAECRTLEEARAQRGMTMVDVIARGPYKPPVTESCPFCGEDPLPAARRGGDYVVSCPDDDCDTHKHGSTVEQAWSRWNTRARAHLREGE